jgi:hypothetical protein
MRECRVRLKRARRRLCRRAGAPLMASLALGTALLASAGTTPIVDDFTTDNLAVLPLSTDLLEGYVGEYQLEENSILSITRDGSTLFGQLTGFKRVALRGLEGERGSAGPTDE